MPHEPNDDPNLAKDLVRTAQFSFKLPRDKTCKLRYTFNFNIFKNPKTDSP